MKGGQGFVPFAFSYPQPFITQTGGQAFGQSTRPRQFETKLLGALLYAWAIDDPQTLPE